MTMSMSQKPEEHQALEAVQDEVDHELLPIFLEEAGELYPQIAGALLAWHQQPDNAQVERKLIHNLHTLKGSARMTGAMRLGELVHRMEDHMAAAARGAPESWDALQSDFVRIGGLIGELGSPFATSVPVEAERSQQGAACVPFGSIGKRLYQVARQTAKETNKLANLELQGTEVELERCLLEKMTAPFEHLLRNAIAHGLESPQQRERAGKEAIGDIRLSLRRDDNMLIFEFSDDGAGLDLVRLRQKAVKFGLLQTPTEASDAQVMQLIFVPGLSTATAVTEISGRGVGMDVVLSEITALGGRIDVSSVPGKGTFFIIRLPYPSALHQCEG
jgi:chemotaxis protein histidine kinase CheA